MRALVVPLLLLLLILLLAGLGTGAWLWLSGHEVAPRAMPQAEATAKVTRAAAPMGATVEETTAADARTDPDASPREAVTPPPAAPPPEIVLPLPAQGVVTVHVRDASGVPIDPTLLDNPLVRLHTYAERPADLRAEADGERGKRVAVTIDAHGDARFSAVDFGRFLIVELAWLTRTSAEPGPTWAMPHVEITVCERRDDVVLTGTLLLADGTPLVRSRYCVQCQVGKILLGTYAKTDGAGRFRVNLSDHPGGKTANVSFDTEGKGSQDGMALELPPRILNPGDNDLGALHLQRHTVLVQGMVVASMANGPPLPQLRVERQRNGRWDRERQVQLRWSDGQRFSFRSGIAKGTPMRLVVEGPGFLPVAPIEFAAGTTGLEVTLRQGGSASATFLVDADVPVERLRFLFRRMVQSDPVDASALEMERVPMMSGGPVWEGRLQRDCSALQPGNYGLQVMCEGTAAPIAVVENLVVTEGPCADPRLVDIDLRGRLRAFEIRATGAGGMAITSPEAFVIVRGDDDHWHGFDLGSGVVKLAAPAALDLIVVAKGHQAAFENGVFDSRMIALEAAPEVQVAVVLPSSLPEGMTLQLTLTPELDLPRGAHLLLDNGRNLLLENFFADEFRVGADDRVPVAVRFPGPYAIAASLQPGGRASRRDLRLEPRTTTLTSHGELSVKIDAKQFARAIAGEGR